MMPEERGLRREASLSFDGGTLIVHLCGHGAEAGSGRFIFDEANVDWKPHDEKSGCYLEVKVARSEIIELRNWLKAVVTAMPEVRDAHR
jgi:hypothetical protein